MAALLYRIANETTINFFLNHPHAYLMILLLHSASNNLKEYKLISKLARIRRVQVSGLRKHWSAGFQDGRPIDKCSVSLSQEGPTMALRSLSNRELTTPSLQYEPDKKSLRQLPSQTSISWRQSLLAQLSVALALASYLPSQQR